MKNKMNAAVVEQFGRPLVFQEWDIPSPGPGQILVAVGAFEVLAQPCSRVESGCDVHRDPPQVVVWKLLLEVDAVIVASGGYCLSS